MPLSHPPTLPPSHPPTLAYSPQQMCVLVDNEPGILSKVSGLLAGRGFNIDSLTVTSTDVAEVSRMTVVLTGNETQMTQAKKQLEDLVNVWAVIDYTDLNSLSTETLLLKVSTVPPADLGMAAGTKAGAFRVAEGRLLTIGGIDSVACLFKVCSHDCLIA